MSTGPDPRRVAMLSAHTSPLEQPGTGDAGGMNVYVLELAKRLAARDVAVEVFTRSTSRHLPPVVEAWPGVTVHHVSAGPFDGLTKDDLPSQLCGFVRDVLREEVQRGPDHFDLVHSHYWLSGQVGTVAAERWDVPLVHTMHTMAKVKNANLAAGDRAEPVGRIAGEEEIVRLADSLVANTDDERRELIDLYGARPDQVRVVHPGVDVDVFRGGRREEARAALGIPDDQHVLLFAGRIQPLKAPDTLVRAAAIMLAERPDLRSTLRVVVVGGASGSGLDRPTALAELAERLGVSDVVTLVPPVEQAVLADWYAAASAVCVPSYNESFGLVAIEAQACGTPVVAARVGGLTTAVADGVSGILVDGQDPAHYAAALGRLIADRHLREAMGAKAVTHAASFGWDATAERTLEVYRLAMSQHQERRLRA
ncbi:D-inositol-3-phosphate glycosyltransferase [Aeromicrobium sp. CF4.19]|uniref:D-inositol-3-phosphate glycosyltransferase n=1 Tax=Aeromicrobium sp. CF4.19 TaxID=3373082 RepID=UPI003EE76A47